jgi:hypothetical protein
VNAPVSPKGPQRLLPGARLGGSVASSGHCVGADRLAPVDSPTGVREQCIAKKGRARTGHAAGAHGCAGRKACAKTEIVWRGVGAGDRNVIRFIRSSTRTSIGPVRQSGPPEPEDISGASGRCQCHRSGHLHNLSDSPEFWELLRLADRCRLRLVPCMVRAVKVSLANLDILKYVSADIIRAPSELPDGAYNVSFDGRTMKVKKIAGNWEAAV